MASRSYKTYKFFYDSDLGRTSIKRQRSYLDSTGDEITPITPLFLTRVVSFAEKVTGTSVGLRHLKTYIDNGIFKANIPYRTAPEIIAHIQEINALLRVDCGDYQGENQVKNASANSF